MNGLKKIKQQNSQVAVKKTEFPFLTKYAERVQELHIKAIELADNAFILKFKGELEAAINKFGEAFQLERQAALLAKEQNIGEPTISVLLKSAASLAINANICLGEEKQIHLKE